MLMKITVYSVEFDLMSYKFRNKCSCTCYTVRLIVLPCPPRPEYSPVDFNSHILVQKKLAYRTTSLEISFSSSI